MKNDEWIKYKTYWYQIELDMYPENPREMCDCLSSFVLEHKRYNFPNDLDVHFHEFSGWEQVQRYLEQEYQTVIIWSVYMYDHSGLALRLNRGFSDIDPQRWDWGQLGFMCVTRENLLKWFNKKKVTKELIEKARTILEGEFKEYAAYLSGQILCMLISDDGGDTIIDSCTGFYDYDDAVKTAKENIDCYHRQDEAIAWKKAMELQNTVAGIEEI